jgi:hypothetical protein
MNELISFEEKRAQRWIIISTVVYSFLVPFLFWMSLFSFMAFDDPHMTKLLGLLFIFLFLCIPLSIPVAIFFMWRRYFQKQYAKARFYCSIPLVTALACYFATKFLELF